MSYSTFSKWMKQQWSQNEIELGMPKLIISSQNKQMTNVNEIYCVKMYIFYQTWFLNRRYFINTHIPSGNNTFPPHGQLVFFTLFMNLL